MKRTSVIMASVGGAAVLAVAGAALGATASDERVARVALAAATVAPTATGAPGGVPSAPGASAPATGTSAPGGAAVPSGAAPAGAVDERRAGEIALARAGGGKVVEVEAEDEDGRQVWSVEVVNGQTEHEIDVDRADGTVVKAEQEPVDDDDSDDDDSDDSDDDDDDKDDDSDD